MSVTFLTNEDKEELELKISELGSGVHVGSEEPTNENTHVWVKTDGANLINNAINEDGTPFVGFKNGYFDYVTGEMTEGEEDEGYFFSGFIPVTTADTLYFHGLDFDSMEWGIVLYDSEFNYIHTAPIWDLDAEDEGYDDVAEFDFSGRQTIVWLDISKLVSKNFYDTPADELAKVAYIRLQGISEYDADCAVTTSEDAVIGDNVLKIKKANGSWQNVGASDSEEWVFELDDGTAVTKQVMIK